MHVYAQDPSAAARRALGQLATLAGLPAWLKAPSLGLLTGTACAAIGYALCRLGFPRARGRRFELPTLQATAAPLLCYLVGLFLFQPSAAGRAQRTRSTPSL